MASLFPGCATTTSRWCTRLPGPTATWPHAVCSQAGWPTRALLCATAAIWSEAYGPTTAICASQAWHASPTQARHASSTRWCAGICTSSPRDATATKPSAAWTEPTAVIVRSAFYYIANARILFFSQFQSLVRRLSIFNKDQVILTTN